MSTEAPLGQALPVKLAILSWVQLAVFPASCPRPSTPAFFSLEQVSLMDWHSLAVPRVLSLCFPDLQQDVSLCERIGRPKGDNLGL